MITETISQLLGVVVFALLFFLLGMVYSYAEVRKNAKKAKQRAIMQDLMTTYEEDLDSYHQQKLQEEQENLANARKSIKAFQY